jgi:hypothetical protein
MDFAGMVDDKVVDELVFDDAVVLVTLIKALNWSMDSMELNSESDFEQLLSYRAEVDSCDDDLKK